ncbi:MAG TPA: DUF1365 domain-containing protein [Burkholderiaceae bacterium]|jgi:DUF1365 family protein|nr:DUF1365 domain-containing protein [Burkholderiaceae bacterium]
MTPPRARMAFGEVRHRRLAPVEHAFAYPTCFLLLPLRALRRAADPALARNRRALFGFRDADHGDGRADSLAWLDELLAAEGIADADGEAWLHCIPRMFGVAFKPVSFWYAHRADGTLAAVVVEVNNTFGERHCYLLAGAQLAFGRTAIARKVFHVSPFCETRGDYRFRFMRTDLASADGRGRTAVRVELHVDGAPLLVTSVSGRVEPLTRGAVRFALWTLPAMTAMIVARIHWHALRLWLGKLAVERKPAPPRRPVSRGEADAAPALRQAGGARVSQASDEAASIQNPA